MKNVNLILGTMTFGESVFQPQVEEFINAFLDAGYDELVFFHRMRVMSPLKSFSSLAWHWMWQV